MTEVRERLTSLLDTHGERASPIAFAGRQSIIDTVFRRLNSISKEPTPGMTFIVNGAPGAGKTTLLNRLAEQQGFRCIHFEEIPSENQIRHAWYEFAAHFTGKTVESFRATRHEERGGEVGLKMGVGASGSYSEGASVNAPEIDAFSQFEHFSEDASRKPVMVCVDEIQNIKADSKAAEFVRYLHTQSIAPVLLVCAGLSNSEQRLHDTGLSRVAPSHVIPLGALQPEETLLAARKSLRVIAETARIDPDAFVDLFAEEIAAASDNWPRHLTSYLQGIGQLLLEQEQPSLHGLDRKQALERGHLLKDEYYVQRLNASQLPARLLASLYSRIIMRPMSRDECAGFLIKAIREDKTDTGEVLRERFESSDDVFEQALRAGVVTYKNNECEIPIPSLATFVNKMANAEQG